MSPCPRVQPGDHVYNPLGHSVDALIWALVASGKPVYLTAAVSADLTWLSPELAEQLRVNVLFGGPGSRQAVNDFRADYTPWWIYGGHKAAEDRRPGARPVDVCLVRVTPPNRAGWCCLGNSLWDSKFAADRARTTIAMFERGGAANLWRHLDPGHRHRLVRGGRPDAAGRRRAAKNALTRPSGPRPPTRRSSPWPGTWRRSCATGTPCRSGRDRRQVPSCWPARSTKRTIWGISRS